MKKKAIRGRFCSEDLKERKFYSRQGTRTFDIGQRTINREDDFFTLDIIGKKVLFRCPCNLPLEAPSCDQTEID